MISHASQRLQKATAALQEQLRTIQELQHFQDNFKHIVTYLRGMEKQLREMGVTFDEKDPVFTASPASKVKEEDIAFLKSLLADVRKYGITLQETDPHFCASPAYDLTKGDVAFIQARTVGKDGKDGKDGNTDVAEVLEIAQGEVKAHEKENNHALLHDPLVLGSKTVDEREVGDGKILQVQGGKLVYKSLPQASKGLLESVRKMQIHGGGVPSQTNNAGKFLTTDGILASWASIPVTINFADKETPAGAINGVNVTYTLAHTPTAGSELLFRNGVLQNSGAGNDYTIAAATITMASAPGTGDILIVSYRY